MFYNDHTNKKIINQIKLPLTIKGNYTSPLNNCDKLHAFNDTHGKIIGGMNNIVNEKLIELYNQKINPDITNINISITKDTVYTIYWEVTINKNDTTAYVGLYSRGHGGNGQWVFNDTDTNKGHASILECKKSNYIKKRGTINNLYLVNDFEYNKNNQIKGCQVNQLFYKYTLKEYPNHVN